MKICIINSFYKPYMRGGAESVVENIIYGLKKKDHDVILITLGRKDEKVVEDGMTVYKISPLNLFSYIDIAKRSIVLRVFWHVFDTFNIFGRKKVKAILQKEKVNVVFTHNLKGIGYLVPRLLKSMQLKHVHTIHDVQLSRPSGLLMYGHEKPFLIMDKMYERICRYLFSVTPVVVSPSWWLLDYYTSRGFFYKSKKKILRNPIGQYEMERDSNERGVMKEERGGKSINFLYLGQLEKSKGIILLIKAFKKLEAHNWKLRIVGTGSLYNEVKTITRGDERFMVYGFVKRAKLSNIFGQSDCTLIPSICYENSPTVLYESFSAGVPVIASDIGGIPELVQDEINGFTFEPGNEKNLQKVLQFYITHPQKIEELKKNTTKSIKDYTVDTYLKKLFGLVKWIDYEKQE